MPTVGPTPMPHPPGLSPPLLHNARFIYLAHTVAGNFGEVFDLANSVKITKLENSNVGYCMYAYGAKNSGCQI